MMRLTNFSPSRLFRLQATGVGVQVRQPQRRSLQAGICSRQDDHHLSQVSGAFDFYPFIYVAASFQPAPRPPRALLGEPQTHLKSKLDFFFFSAREKPADVCRHTIAHDVTLQAGSALRGLDSGTEKVPHLSQPLPAMFPPSYLPSQNPTVLMIPSGTKEAFVIWAQDL